ncbi:MAG: hypothetical protein O3C05_00595 [Proteobacteria bacterium]|nr:hypothetical protein [Pseudomonadota bacterium]
MRSVLIIMAIILIQTVSFAQDIAISKQNARSIGEGLLGKVQGTASSSIEGNNDLAKGLNYKGTSSRVLPQKNMNSEQLKGEAELMKKGSIEGELIEKGFMNREDYDTDALRKDLNTAKDAQKNPERYIGDLLSQSKECEQINKEDITSKTKETCDEYVDWKDNNCKVGQVVKVDAKHDYKCRVTREKREGVCNKKLRAWCDGGVRDCGYDAGGMVQGSIDGNIFWRANYPNLYLGTIDKVRDSGRCHIIDKNINFIVKNKDSIKELRVTNIQYSDWIRISVNGVQAYNSMGGEGPYWRERSWHGGYGEFTNLHSGSIVKTCNTKRFYNTNPNVDLVPYVRDGNNTIRIELAFGNSGRLYVELRATQYCCTVKEEWDDECERLKP